MFPSTGTGILKGVMSEKKNLGAGSRRLSITRILGFSAGHRLYNIDLSEEENRRIFGKCASIHGHNYSLEVSVTGDIDPKTGYAVNFDRLDQVLREEVVSRLDHKNLNEEVPGLENRIITAETICLWIWDRVRDTLGERLPNVMLQRIRLYETDRSYVEYSGESDSGT
jgi:6-pyruvoyltetrahydropterin/6-carboxytetrahydropterin synthase